MKNARVRPLSVNFAAWSFELDSDVVRGGVRIGEGEEGLKRKRERVGRSGRGNSKNEPGLDRWDDFKVGEIDDR